MQIGTVRDGLVAALNQIASERQQLALAFPQSTVLTRFGLGTTKLANPEHLQQQ